MHRIPRLFTAAFAAATLLTASAASLADAHRTGPVTRAALRADRECARTQHLRHRYSRRVLTVALRLLPADVAEYTNCVEVLRTARARAPRHRHPAERARRRAA